MNNDWRWGDRIKVNGIEEIGTFLKTYKNNVILRYSKDDGNYDIVMGKSECINLSANGRKTARTTQRNQKGKFMKKDKINVFQYTPRADMATDIRDTLELADRIKKLEEKVQNFEDLFVSLAFIKEK
jgi:hypothetical protein